MKPINKIAIGTSVAAVLSAGALALMGGTASAAPSGQILPFPEPVASAAPASPEILPFPEPVAVPEAVPASSIPAAVPAAPTAPAAPAATPAAPATTAKATTPAKATATAKATTKATAKATTKATTAPKTTAAKPATTTAAKPTTTAPKPVTINGRQVPSNVIGNSAALSVALKHAGVTSAQATRVQNKLDYDDGRWNYEIEFVSGTTEYSYEIDALNRAILDRDRDSIYDD